MKSIVDYLKKYGQENGLDSYSTSKSNYGKKRSIEESASTYNKKMKRESTGTCNQNLNNENFRHQNGILLRKTIMSILVHAPKI